MIDVVIIYNNDIDPATIVSDIEVEVRDTMYQFTVMASGTSPLTYTWHINDAMQDSDGPTLTVSTNVTQERTIEVKVQVANRDPQVGAIFNDTSTIVIYVVGEYLCICMMQLPYRQH